MHAFPGSILLHSGGDLPDFVGPFILCECAVVLASEGENTEKQEGSSPDSGATQRKINGDLSSDEKGCQTKRANSSSQVHSNTLRNEYFIVQVVRTGPWGLIRSKRRAESKFCSVEKDFVVGEVEQSAGTSFDFGGSQGWRGSSRNCSSCVCVFFCRERCSRLESLGEE